MKKQLAIFTFLIFFLSQFGRVINFCLCSITVYQQTNSFHCDCEKQLVNTGDTQKQPHSNATSLPQTEELYHLDNSGAYSFTPAVPVIIYINGNSESLYNAYCATIFHPPGHSA